MIQRFRTGFTSAHVIAAAALFIALGGTAIGLSKNSVGTKQLKKNAVKTRKIANSAVTTAKLGDGAVVTSKILNDAVTGAKVNEATLSQVPLAAQAAQAVQAQSATSADTAARAGTADLIGNTQVEEVFFRTDAVTNQDVFSGGGLTINAGCTAGNTVTLTASTGVDNAALLSYSIDVAAAGGGLIDNNLNNFDFDTGENPLNLVPEDAADQVMTLQYVRPSTTFFAAGVVTGQWQINRAGNVDCEVTGHVLRTGGTSIF